ncbi:MAG TPA: cytochrome c oxidase subunit I, partial [Puia sp.]
MSTDLTIHGPGEAIVSHDPHEAGHNGLHHKETFITKYVFSMDHKMICKQFLITGMIWALIGGLMSVLFRLQLGYPDSTFPWLEDILG